MPIKRRVLDPTGAAPKRRAVRRRVEEGSEPRILSAEEKHELILAHAAARQPFDPLQRVTLMVGVFISVVFVAGAWLYTVGSGIQKSLASPMDPNLKTALDSAKQITNIGNSTATGATLSDQASNLVDTLSNLAKQQAVVDALTGELSTGTIATRPDLFQAPFSTTTTTSTPTTKPKATK